MSRWSWMIAAAALMLTALVYWPGLHGGFLFDDFPFVVDNIDIHVTTLRLGDWVAAAVSFPAGHQGRWLSMASFAANFYLTGLDPFWMKLTNLGIHLANGMLVFVLMGSLFAFRRTVRAEGDSKKAADDVVAACIAATWLVLPINLTSVLYVAQRLESLSNTFVMAGLVCYLHARRLHFSGRGGLVGMVGSLLLFTALGLLFKESAVLLPLYALCIEIALPGGRNADGRRSSGVRYLFSNLLGIPWAVGCIWLLSWIDSPTTYAREFTMVQRLLTEARVLCDYIGWILLPRLDILTLFHDDFVISTSAFSPATTLPAIIFLAFLLVVAVRQRSSYPMFCLGILWFFAGHALTATVIPLELAFEHRNYFPSIGLLLAAVCLLAQATESAGATLRVSVAACLTLFLALVTNLRANEWSDPLRLAATEASKRPDSANAQYEYAHLLVITAKTKSAPALGETAIGILKKQVARSRSSILPEQMLIELSAQARQPIDDTWWTSITAKLQQRPPSAPDVSALTELTQCQLSKRCPSDTKHLLAAFLAALSHPGAGAPLLAVYADFAAIELHDSALAEHALREAIARRPDEPTYRGNLVRLLLATGDFDRAEAEITLLTRMSAFGSLDGELAKLHKELDAARLGAAALPTGL